MLLCWMFWIVLCGEALGINEFIRRVENSFYGTKKTFTYMNYAILVIILIAIYTFIALIVDFNLSYGS